MPAGPLLLPPLPAGPLLLPPLPAGPLLLPLLPAGPLLLPPPGAPACRLPEGPSPSAASRRGSHRHARAASPLRPECTAPRGGSPAALQLPAARHTAGGGGCMRDREGWGVGLQFCVFRAMWLCALCDSTGSQQPADRHLVRGTLAGTLPSGLPTPAAAGGVLPDQGAGQIGSRGADWIKGHTRRWHVCILAPGKRPARHLVRNSIPRF